MTVSTFNESIKLALKGIDHDFVPAVKRKNNTGKENESRNKKKL